MRHFVAISLAAVVALGVMARMTERTVYTQSVDERNVPGIPKPVVVVRGRFTSDLTMTADKIWVLRGAVFFAAPAVLRIEPGTLIAGETATRGTLVIEQGAQIIADGTAAAPIVMTSDQPVGLRGRGDWGGLILNGRAPVNLPGGVGLGEGSTGVYGGTNPNDSSGVLRYVRVEFAGIEFSPDNELNGIAFQGVGNGTIVDHVQVHFNLDDAVEFFGGTVDIKHIVATGIGDDSFDWTFGWRGRMQFGIAQQRGDDTDNGIEADNNGASNDLLPRSAPTIYNITMVGDPSFTYGPESTDGMRLREGTAGIIGNAIVIGFKGDGVDVRNTSTFNQIANGSLRLWNSILFGNGRTWPSASQPLIDAANGTISTGDPVLVNPFNLTAPDFRPVPGGLALTWPPAAPPLDGWFETAPYIGALGPALATDWTRGWTSFAQN